MRIHGQGVEQGFHATDGAQEMDKSLLQEECLRLKAQIKEVKNTMKETLKSVDKL